jgi:hypothetical protein
MTASLGGVRSIPRSRVQLAAPIALILAGGLMVACTSSPAATVAPATVAPSTVAPATNAPAPASPTAGATVQPGSAIHVVLAQATGKDVTIDVADASGTLLSATSGTPGDGASVEPYKLIVANDNPTTLRLTWVGGPCDSANTLSIDSTKHQFLIVQPECAGDTVVTDRVLVLTFSTPISADDIEPFLQDGLDT